MPLSPGARFGPYEVLDLLGAGGMGEVYRARDTRLKREVAICVRPFPGLAAGGTDKVVFIFNFFDGLRRLASVSNYR